MTTPTPTPTPMHTELQPKKNYTTPKLITYGEIRSLTQAGSVAINENMGHPQGRL